MNKKIDIIKEIAYKLSDYKYVLQVMNDPQNKQKMINKMISLFDEKTLSHGLPAICMLYAELSYIFPDEEWDIKAHEYLQILQKNMENREIYDLSMFSGYAGIGLTVRCLSKNGERYCKLKGYINQLIHSALYDLIEQLYKSKYCFMRDYDVISGLSGILSYTILEDDLIDANEKIGEYLVYRCQNILYKNTKIFGLYIPRENQFLEQDKLNFPNGNFNLGLSHGIPGVLLALCMLKKYKYNIMGLDDAIHACASLLYKFIDKREQRWNAYLSLDENLNGRILTHQTRDAWCYGSPGVSYALYASGVLLKNENFCKLSINVMKNMINNVKGIYSPTFCHGYIGVAYIYWRFYEMTGIIEFEKYANQLSDKIWEFYSENNPFGFKDIEYIGSTHQIGLLSGVVGILLPLLAIYGYKETKWDNAFMLGSFFDE